MGALTWCGKFDVKYIAMHVYACPTRNVKFVVALGRGDFTYLLQMVTNIGSKSRHGVTPLP